MYAACANGHLDVIKYIVEDQHCRLVWQSTTNSLLQLACENGHLDIVKYLVEEQQCNPKRYSYLYGNHWTPLVSACQHGHLNNYSKISLLRSSNATPGKCQLISTQVIKLILRYCTWHAIQITLTL